MKKLKKILRRLVSWIIFLLTFNGEIADEAKKANIIDRSGQGR